MQPATSADQSASAIAIADFLLSHISFFLHLHTRCDGSGPQSDRRPPEVPPQCFRGSLDIVTCYIDSSRRSSQQRIRRPGGRIESDLRSLWSSDGGGLVVCDYQ